MKRYFLLVLCAFLTLSACSKKPIAKITPMPLDKAFSQVSQDQSVIKTREEMVSAVCTNFQNDKAFMTVLPHLINVANYDSKVDLETIKKDYDSFYEYLDDSGFLKQSANSEYAASLKKYKALLLQLSPDNSNGIRQLIVVNNMLSSSVHAELYIHDVKPIQDAHPGADFKMVPFPCKIEPVK